MKLAYYSVSFQVPNDTPDAVAETLVARIEERLGPALEAIAAEAGEKVTVSWD